MLYKQLVLLSFNSFIVLEVLLVVCIVQLRVDNWFKVPWLAEYFSNY